MESYFLNKDVLIYSTLFSSLFFSFLLFSSTLFHSRAVLGNGLEGEEQRKRKPSAMSQERAHDILKHMNKKVSGKRRPPSFFTRDVVGNLTSLKGEKDTSKEEKQECLADEHQFLRLESTVIKSWAESWMSQDGRRFSKLLKRGAKVANFMAARRFPKSSTKNLDGLEISHWVEKPSSGGGNIQKYLSSFEKIEDVELMTKKIHVPMLSRNKGKRDLSMVYIEAEIRVDIRGFALNKRREDRGYLSVVFEQENKKNGKIWKISKIEILEMTTLQKRRPSFTEVTEKLSPVKSYNRIEAIRRGGYALSTADYDGDGILDILVGSYGPLQLFRGLKDGSYEEVKKSGISPHLYVKSAVFADFNNDGKQDLLIVRFAPSKRDRDTLRNDIIIYENLGRGQFKRTRGFAERSYTDYAMPSAVADFNGDGLLDLYIGYPGNKDFSSFGVNFDFKKKLKAQGVYINRGGFVFSPQKMSKQADYEKYTGIQKVFPHSAAAIDFNQDGRVDIVVIDDRGNLSPLYENIGGGFFAQKNQSWNIENSGYGMGIASADLNNDGLTDILMTNVSFNASERLFTHCRENWDVDLGLGFPSIKQNQNGIKAFLGTKLGGKKRFIESAKAIGLSNTGDGLAGVEFLDYNNDGHMDIYVTNGLWSGTSRYNDLSSHFARISDVIANDRVLMEVRDKTQSQIMNILSFYRGGVFGEKKSRERLSLGGFQRNRLFRNLGDGTFLEVGFLEGVDSIADGYVVSRADINNDGRLDLILRNADPGTADVRYPPVQVFENTHGNKNSLRIKLLASKGNRDGIGAEVILKTENLTQVQQLIANLGTSQSEKTLHFGLGKSKIVKSLIVEWPGGKVAKYKDIRPGFIVIRESDQL